MVLADLERRRGTSVDVERLMRMALLHDAEEARTGDVHHPFKHQDAAFAEALDSRAFEWFGGLLSGLPPDLAKEYVALRKAEREASTEGELLKAADKIEALLWAYEEYLLGNIHVRQALIVEDILSKLEQIHLGSVEALVADIRSRLGSPSS
jgi:5'-deoxynucleotidase YfbR-like HD superfamily hydrolase